MSHSKRFLLIFVGAIAFGCAVQTAWAQEGRDGQQIPDSVLGAGSGGCFVSNGSPGCNDQACESLICAQDAFCCSNTWDGICAAAALEQCDIGARATFKVNKYFNDGNPSEVDVHLDCNNGLIPDQVQNLADGSPIEFVITDFDNGQLNCEIFEIVPPGYEVSAFSFDGTPLPSPAEPPSEGRDGGSFTDPDEVSGLPGDSDCLIANGTPGCEDVQCESEVCAVDPFCCSVSWDGLCVAEAEEICGFETCVFQQIGFGEEFTCDIYNDIIPIDFDVQKLWIDEHPEFKNPMIARARPDCGDTESPAKPRDCGGGSGKSDCSNGGYGWWHALWFDGQDDYDTFQVWPHWDGMTVCSVEERIHDSSVETDASDCQNVKVLLGQDDAVPPTDYECTIVNTRIYEGVPTLSQYGMAVLLLMMLGVGLLGFRRMS